MAAGLSKKQITTRIYNRLHSIQRDLGRLGVSTMYCRGTRYKPARLVLFEQRLAPGKDGGFNITYHTAHLSNGEVGVCGEIFVSLAGERRLFGLREPHGNFKQGLDFIKRNFAQGGGQ